MVFLQKKPPPPPPWFDFFSLNKTWFDKWRSHLSSPKVQLQEAEDISVVSRQFQKFPHLGLKISFPNRKRKTSEQSKKASERCKLPLRDERSEWQITLVPQPSFATSNTKGKCQLSGLFLKFHQPTTKND